MKKVTITSEWIEYWVRRQIALFNNELPELRSDGFLFRQWFLYDLDMEYDAIHVPFPGDNHFMAMISHTMQLEIPETIYFQANFNTIPKYDFPIVDLADAIFSNRLLEVFIDRGIPVHRKIPVVMFDDSFLDEPFNPNGKLKPGVKTDLSYSILQLLEFTPAFDYENAVFEVDDLFPEDVGFIKKLVLKKPDGGFPSLFRIKENTVILFVNEAARNEIERSGMSGCVFEAVEVSDQ